MPKIMLVSKNKDSLNELKQFIEIFAFVSTITDAIDTLKQHGDFSSVIVDRPSDYKNIADLTRYIKSHNTYVSATAVLALTDSGHKEQDSSFMELGFTECMTRPLYGPLVRRRIKNAEDVINNIAFDKFAEMLKNLPANIYLKDASGRYVFSSQTWHHLDTGNDKNWTIRGKTDIEIRKDVQNAILAMNSDQKVIETGKGMQYIIKEDNGKEFLQLIKEPLFDDEGNVNGIIALINNVTEQELMRRKLKEQALHDPLTGLYNRQYLNEYILKLREHSVYPLCVISADCDDLKGVNDTYGHVFGDMYIRQSVNLMLSSFPAKARLFRVGGDEFIAFIPNMGIQEAEALIKDTQSQPSYFYVNERQMPVNLSFGCAIINSKYDDIDEMIRISDNRMYEQKRQRKAALGSKP